MHNNEFDLAKFLPFELHQASETQSQAFAKVYREKYGITRTEWRVFAHIGQTDRMTATQIGLASRLHKTKVSRAVSSLQKRGWIKRDTQKSDRRVQYLSMSKVGATVYAELANEASLFNKKVAEHIGEEAFKEILKHLRNLQRNQGETG